MMFPTDENLHCAKIQSPSVAKLLLAGVAAAYLAGCSTPVIAML